MPNDEELYISTRYLRGLLDYVRSKDAPLEPVLRAMQLSENELRDPDRHIPHALQDRIFAAAEAATRDVNVGLHAGETTHIMHFGIVGQLAMTCNDGRDLLDLGVRYQGLIGNGVRSSYSVLGEEVVLEFQTLRATPHSRHSIEYTLAAQMTLARLLAGPDFRPNRLELDYDASPEAEEVERVFRCPLLYPCPNIRVLFPATVLPLKLLAGDSDLRPPLEFEARRRLDALRVPMRHDDPEIARLKQYVADRLSSGTPTVEQAAEAMGTFVRTLQRRLEVHGLSYRDVVDLVRRDVAERLMGDPSLSLLDVALLLGFSHQSAFNRAFRRWFQVAPRELRARSSKG